MSMTISKGTHLMPEIASLIDHTLLSPDATEADIKKLCAEAKKYGFFSVCVHPSFIKTAKQMLTGTGLK